MSAAVAEAPPTASSVLSPSSPSLSSSSATATTHQTVKQTGDHYFLQENASEVQRLTYQHEVIKAHMGSLIFAPVPLSQPNLRILDSATADGRWLRDVSSHLTAPYQLVGTDIVAGYFPAQRPAHTELLLQDIASPWPEEMRGSFDLVHQRLALPGCGTHPMRAAVEGLLGLMKPGGWIQLIEADHSGPASEGVAMRESFRLIKELFRGIGVDDVYARALRGWLEEMGMEEVREKVLDVRLGAANEDAGLAIKGTRSFVLATQGLVKVARRVPTSFTSEQLDKIVPDMERELNNVGGIHRLYCVWGRKPL